MAAAYVKERRVEPFYLKASALGRADKCVGHGEAVAVFPRASRYNRNFFHICVFLRKRRFTAAEIT
jgi:hypothetical protein